MIPAAFRRELGIRPGDPLVLTLEDGQLHLTTREHAVVRAQQAVRGRLGSDRSLVEELIQERRAEAGSD